MPHHLIDVVDLTDNFDAARFITLAGRAVTGIHSRGHIPIFCGGTGLYFRAWLEGLGDAPPSDAKLRDFLEATPLNDLLNELEKSDPRTFAGIDRQNPRRVIRAVEVIRLTGKPFSSQRANWSANPALPAPAFFALRREASDLHQRIDRRVEAMFQTGLVEEARELLKAGLQQNPTAMQAIGYRQVVEHLRGERSLSQTIDLVKIRTRQFAKRQMTWFRRQAAIEWIPVPPAASAESIAMDLLDRMNSRRGLPDQNH